MNKITSVLVDDEFSNREVLKSMLERYCPSVELLGEASSAAEGLALINQVKPDMIFLDVKMPVQSGFDMLRMFDEIDFRIVFVTAHDEFAFQAFEFSAMDYILKPIDYTKLIRAIQKVELSISQNSSNDAIHFVRSVDERTHLLKSISFHLKDRVVLVDIDDISYVQADRNYCVVVTKQNERFTSSKTLADYETMLSAFSDFLRINKSHIINLNYLQSYSKGATCMIEMLHSPFELEVSRRKKGEILQHLKNRNV